MTVDPATALPDAAPAESEPRKGLVGLLVADGALCAVLSVFYLGLYIGGVPFPITILLAAVINLLLVMAVRTETGSLGTAAWPLLAWVVGFGLCLLGGPGGDMVVVADWRILLLPIAALAPAGFYLFSARINAITQAARQSAPRP
ncbi:hypothetical protein [Rhodococcus chondri]|uniref:Integral membrane protein n=1 Tax=Rhodococcus chondri TaxID=3065941 RepID=A0ABU7JYZ9_9NOCA|nr:hypothetical protein [Rhodococcus sp. CC-R104]MEE2034527.1 hypothetical protein [Rhodococcus sp. CC-R104]